MPAIRFGIRDMNTVSFIEGVVLEEIPQMKKERGFAASSLEEGCGHIF